MASSTEDVSKLNISSPKAINPPKPTAVGGVNAAGELD